MKALSVRQPYASLIACGLKPIENRTWRTSFRGRIFIHASAPRKGNLAMTDEQITASLPVLGISNGNFPFGAIIGEVDIVDCVINHSSIWAEQTKVIGSTVEGEILYSGTPIYNWVLENAVLYDNPILNVKGALFFWKTDYQHCETCGVVHHIDLMHVDEDANWDCESCYKERLKESKK